MPTSPSFIDLPTAASRSGRSRGHLARRCREWSAAGMARLEKPPEGGKPRWIVREDADAAIARVKFPEQMGGEKLKALSKAKRDEASRRLQILRAWGEAVGAAIKLGYAKAAGTGKFLEMHHIDSGEEISERTLYRWERQYREQGLAGLVDSRGGKSHGDHGDDLFFDHVKSRYLSLRRPSLRICHEMVCQLAREQGFAAHSYRTTARWMDRIPKAVLLKYRFGDEAHTNEAEPYIERDYSGLDSNGAWCGDHHQFDVIVNHQGQLVRPWITAWQDMRSRKIVGYRIFATDPNQDTILLAIRDGVLAHGVPEAVYIDNGKDYDSYALNGRTKRDRWAKRKIRLQYDVEQFSGVFVQLGVRTIHCEPYHGQSKPIERFFRTLEGRFCKVGWGTYCGNSPANKPEDLQLQIERGNAPTIEYFAECFDRWLVTDYHGRVHEGQGMDDQSPDQCFAANLHARRTASDALLDLLLMQKSKPVKVTQNGVMHKGLRYGQYEASLIPHLGQEVALRFDPNHAAAVQVWTTGGKFICHAQANAKIPVLANSQDLRAAMAQKRRHTKALRDYHQVRLRMHEDLSDLVVRAAHSRNAAQAQPEPPEPRLKPIRSPLEEQLAVIQNSRPQPFRTAVGAESMSPSQAGETSGRFVYKAAFAASDEDSGD